MEGGRSATSNILIVLGLFSTTKICGSSVNVAAAFIQSVRTTICDPAFIPLNPASFSFSWHYSATCLCQSSLRENHLGHFGQRMRLAGGMTKRFELLTMWCRSCLSSVKHRPQQSHWNERSGIGRCTILCPCRLRIRGNPMLHWSHL